MAALAVFVIAVAAVVVVLGLGSGSSSADSSPTVANRTLAGHEAGRLLSGARVPAGAIAVTTSASGDHVSSLQLLGSPSAPYVAVRTRTWSVPEPAARVAAFLLAHPVSGTRPERPTVAEVVFTADRLASGLTAERITFVLTRGGPHATIVHASAMATWVVARPASEVVPAAAHVVDIVRGKPGHAPGIALKVTDPQLTVVRKLIDSLATVQPGRFNCPAQINGLPRVTFIFRAHEGGRILAVAGENADVVEPTTACDPLDFSIGGQARTPLLRGAALLRTVSRIVGHRLWLAPYAA